MANSTNIISDLRTVSTSIPTAASTSKAISPTGPITDLVGLVTTILAECQTLKWKLTAVQNASDSSGPDPNYFTIIGNIIGTLGS